MERGLGLLKLFYINALSEKDLNYNYMESKIMENGNFENHFSPRIQNMFSSDFFVRRCQILGTCEKVKIFRKKIDRD